MAEKKTSTRKHRAFDKMTCPVKSCDTMGGKPQEGTVPGIKRHVRKLHADEYDKITWPAIREADEKKAAAKADAKAKETVSA